MSDSLRPHELQHARPPCSSPTPRVHSDSRPSSLWCHPAISSSVIPFPSCPQSLPASESFPVSQLFAWGGQSTGVSALALTLRESQYPWKYRWVLANQSKTLRAKTEVFQRSYLGYAVGLEKQKWIQYRKRLSTWSSGGQKVPMYCIINAGKLLIKFLRYLMWLARNHSKWIGATILKTKWTKKQS